MRFFLHFCCINLKKFPNFSRSWGRSPYHQSQGRVCPHPNLVVRQVAPGWFALTFCPATPCLKTTCLYNFLPPMTFCPWIYCRETVCPKRQFVPRDSAPFSNLTKITHHKNLIFRIPNQTTWIYALLPLPAHSP